jgi:mono/diheme cytochrome c family protein/DNA-binding beta-propeller fold protein YncE
MRRLPSSAAALVLLAALAHTGAASAAEGEALFKSNCAECHGGDRFGRTGPALLPESLARLRRTQAIKTVTGGLPATQMPGFEGKLSPEEIAAVVDYIYTPLAAPPRWDMAAISASRETPEAKPQPPKLPVYDADPLNLFVVVESGDHHITILDGDRFEPIARFKSRLALHGGPKFTADGRYVFFASRDGWVSKYDLHALRLVAEIRAGINTRNIALSPDGRTVAVANYLPHTLVLLDGGDLSPIKVIETKDRTGKESSRVSAVYQAAPRESFVVALKDIPELWEISYAASPPPVFSGLVHSHEKGMVEGLTKTERFPVRRIALDQPLDDFFFDREYRNLIGSARDGKQAVVINLNVGRAIKSLPLEGLPHLGSGISWTLQGRTVMATPHLKEAALTVVDTGSWEVVKRISTPGPGFFLRSHENSPYAWADVFLGAQKDTALIIDKQSLEIVRTLRPAPGKTAAHVEFTRDGRHALLSIWEMDGAIVVYDAKTLEEVKRIPMVKPSGKYNVYNKTRLSEGTSH